MTMYNVNKHLQTKFDGDRNCINKGITSAKITNRSSAIFANT